MPHHRWPPHSPLLWVSGTLSVPAHNAHSTLWCHSPKRPYRQSPPPWARQSTPLPPERSFPFLLRKVPSLFPLQAGLSRPPVPAPALWYFSHSFPGNCLQNHAARDRVHRLFRKYSGSSPDIPSPLSARRTHFQCGIPDGCSMCLRRSLPYFQSYILWAERKSRADISVSFFFCFFSCCSFKLP